MQEQEDYLMNQKKVYRKRFNTNVEKFKRIRTKKK